MTQKVLAARSGDPTAVREAGELVTVEVDQVVLARSPMRVLGHALAEGMKRAPAEVAVAYEGRCIGSAVSPAGDELPIAAPLPVAEMIGHGVVVARAGVGFPAPVHLERFASPARLCVTDEPRLSGVGGIGMLTLVVPTSALAQALARGSVQVRMPVSVQVVLSGRLRPFVCARDVALELVRSGLGETVRRVEEARGAPVVLEFAGPSVRSLSVGERGVLASVAPQFGAAAALFVSDERTEVFLRDQRRSKAHRVLLADAGAPEVETVHVDLSAVDPLILDDQGQVRVARDLAGGSVSQVLIGGDSGVTLRDLLAVAALLKSKRVPSRVDFLLAVPSRQMLEVLAAAGALTDLIATGARLIEPDARVVSGDLYGVQRAGVAMQTSDPEPRAAGRGRSAVVASAETLAFAVATGEVGDPRSFKRPVRITVPRVLPTDDVLVARKAERADARGAGAKRAERPEPVRALAREGLATFPAWKTAQTLEVVDRLGFVGGAPAQSSQQSSRTESHIDSLADGSPGAERETSSSQSTAAGLGRGPVAVVCGTLDEVRDLASRAPEIAQSVRAVLAPYIPASLVALLSAVGIAPLRIDASAVQGLLGQKTIVLPPPAQWPERQATTVLAGSAKIPVTWLEFADEWAAATGVGKSSPTATNLMRGRSMPGAAAKTATSRS
jgi:aconitate hydratase